jgi:2',3'-cyclic-nucleotide 2'-phosphodiesterase (5'-nucleotidase family)
VEGEITDFLCRESRALGIDAIGLGLSDLEHGMYQLQKLAGAYKLPFTTANVFFGEDGKQIFPRYLLVKRGGLTFGIVSITDPAQQHALQDKEGKKGSQIRIASPDSMVREILPELEQKADTIVLLSQLGWEGTMSFVKQFEGIDVAVVGNMARPVRTERIVNGTVMLCAVYEGRTIGKADLGIGPDGHVEDVVAQVVDLGPQIADDPIMRQKLEKLSADLKDQIRDVQERRFGKE